MNVQEKLAAIEQHTAKALIEIRELMLELAETDPQNTPPAVASFARRARLRAEAKNKPPPQIFPGMQARAVAARKAGKVWPEDAA